VLRQHLRFAIGCVGFALLGAGTLAAQSPVSLGDNQVLVVWKVGSPDSTQTPDSAVPLKFEAKAKSMGLRLQVRALTANEFAQEFPRAFAAHQAPDIIAAENAFSIDAPGNYKRGPGIAADPEVRRGLTQVYGSLIELEGPRGGKEFLLSTSEHADAARRFALRPPDCDTVFVARTSVPPDLQQTAVQIADAYLSAPEKLKAYDDPDRLMTEGARWASANVGETTTCGYWGNDRLAFVSVLSTFERTNASEEVSRLSITHGPLIGQMPVLLVLRKQQAQWRLLAAAIDPVSNDPFLHQIPEISWLLRDPADEETGVTPARLLSPENGRAPTPNEHQRFGDFTWQPSLSGNVVAQIVEFAYENDDRLFFSAMRNHAGQDRISAGLLWATGNEWKWRVWSISDTGAIAFSDFRTFRH
jgi:hypothetical protein